MSLEDLGQGRISRWWSHGQGHTNVTKYTHLWVAGLQLKGNLVAYNLLWLFNTYFPTKCANSIILYNSVT